MRAESTKMVIFTVNLIVGLLASQLIPPLLDDFVATGDLLILSEVRCSGSAESRADVTKVAGDLPTLSKSWTTSPEATFQRDHDLPAALGLAEG